MNSFPTPLNPWYVIARNTEGHTEYYGTNNEGDGVWSRDKTEAFLFMGPISAYRVQKIEDGSFVLALLDKDKMKEWGR